MLMDMSSKQNSLRTTSVSDTEEEIKVLLKSLTAEIEREVSIKECRQATSRPSIDVAA
tara:strand:- start:190 stop:363 length:174 start_codon:yes stop_codon:yes gene_type:complete